MADRIIVTVYSEETQKNYDMEIPVVCEAGRLTEDIADTISGIEERTYNRMGRLSLWDDRLKKMLAPEKSLKEQGVRNGDYLYLTETSLNTSDL